MRFPRRRWLWLALLAIGLLPAIYLTTLLAFRTDSSRQWLERRLSTATRGDVHLGELRLGYDLALHADSFSAAAPGQEPYLRSNDVEVRFSYAGWLVDQPVELELTRPELFPERLPPSEPTSASSHQAPLPVRALDLEDGYVHLRLEGEDVAVGPLSLHMRPGSTADHAAVQVALPSIRAKIGPRTWTMQKASLDGEITPGEQGWHIDAKFSVDSLSGKDSGGEQTIERLALDGTAKGEWATQRQLEVELKASGGEVLWNGIYADLKQSPASLRAAAQPTAKGINLEAMRVSVGGIGSMEGRTSIDGGTVSSFDGSAKVASLSPLFEVAIRDPWQESSPFLAQTKVTGAGSVEAHYRARSGGSSWTGSLHLTKLNVTSADPELQLVDAELALPLQFGTKVRAVAAENGTLRFDSLRLGKLLLPQTKTGLRVTANQIAFAAPLTLPLLGGALTIDSLQASQLHLPKRKLDASLGLRDLDLGAVTLLLDWPDVRGTLDGQLAQLRLDATELRTEGTIEARVFEGNVRLRNPSITALASIPTVELGVTFDDISLRQLTKTLSFGRISGVVHGAVDNLAIAAGEPTRFDAWMETKEQGKEKQSISVRAIRQISILGGSGGDPISGAVMRLFDEYGYSVMGFRCRLENDRFLLHGVRTVEGKEYLVVGSLLPPRVDVITHTELISFSDMVGRLRRIGAESPSTQPEGAER